MKRVFCSAGMEFRNCFTLVELLVVVAIITILAGILLPTLNKAREHVLRSSCQDNLRQIGIGLLSYSEDFGRIPALSPSSSGEYTGVSGAEVQRATGEKVGLGYFMIDLNAGVYGCPGHPELGPTQVSRIILGGGAAESAYLYRETDNNFNSRISENRETPAVVMDNALTDAPGAHDKRYTNILFYDGQVRGFYSSETANEKFTHDNTEAGKDAVWTNADNAGKE